MNQKTIARSIDFEGPSVVSDEPTYMVIRPAELHSRISFRRLDLGQTIPCHLSYLCQRRSTKWTSLQRGEARIEATEHLLAALFAMGITNACIDLDGPGIPLLDGSALPFIEWIKGAGIVDQGEVYVPKFSLRREHLAWELMTDFRTGKKLPSFSCLFALPAEEGLHVGYLLDYKNTALQTQFVELELTPETFTETVAPARTFMTPWELDRWWPGGPEPLLSHYFCMTVPVVTDEEVFEERIPNEAACHKILDMIGDLAILGLQSGSFFGVRSGHSLNKKMVRRIRANG